MHPLESAVRVKGSPEFSKSELVGILSFRLRVMSVSDAKRAIEEWVEEGLLEEDGDTLRVKENALVGLGKAEGLFEEMLSHVASSLGFDTEELLDELEDFSKRYGSLDKKLVLYLFGVEKGVDMERFRDRLELE